MFILFYGWVIIGAVLLTVSVQGRLTVPAEQVSRWRVLGLVAAAGPGLAPFLAWLTGSLGASWPFPIIAIGYVLAFAILAIGVQGWLGDGASRSLRRVGYLALLVLGALPSWVLLVLTPATLLAGASLVEPRAAAATV